MTALPISYGVAIGAAGWLLALAVARRTRDRLAQRLGPSRENPPGRGGLQPPKVLRTRAESRGWDRGPWSYGATLAGAAVATAVGGYVLAGPVAALAGTMAGPMAVEGALSRRVAGERVSAEEHLREVILAFAAGTRAGLSIRRAVAEAARDAGPPLAAELDRVVARMEVGEPLEAALDGLAARLDLPELRLVVTVLSVHRRTGGDLAVMLEEVADVVGDRIRSRREVRALTAQGRASGAVLAVLPIAFVALLSGTGGEALGAFYRSPLGAGLLAVGLVCEVLGFAWIRRIVRRAETS
jgi:tight adherence protein B